MVQEQYRVWRDELFPLLQANGIATYGGDARQALYQVGAASMAFGPPFIDMSVSASDIDGVVGIFRCVDRCCPSARHALLSEMPSSAVT